MESDSDGIRIWRNESDTDGDHCKMEVTWNIRRPRTQALVLIGQITSTTERLLPALLWHSSTDKKKMRYSTRTCSLKLTLYGLESADMKNYTIASSAQDQRYITTSGNLTKIFLSEPNWEHEEGYFLSESEHLLKFSTILS